MKAAYLTRAGVALSLGGLLAGCSGGGSSPITPQTSPVSASQGQSAVSITFRFPGKGGAAPATSDRRSPKYLSFATKSAKVTLTNNAGGAVTTFSFPSLSQTATGCTVVQSDLVCTEAQFAPPGSYTAAAVAYDQQNFGGNITSQLANFATTVAPGNQSVLLTLGGLVQTAQVTIVNAAPMTAPPTTQTVQVLAYDADNYIIVGPYSSAITLTDSDPGTSTQLQVDGQTPGPTIGTSNSGDTIVLLYNKALTTPSDTIGGSIQMAGQTTAPTLTSAVFAPTSATGRSLFYSTGSNNGGVNVTTLFDFDTATMTGTSPDNVALYTVPGALYQLTGAGTTTYLTPQNELIVTGAGGNQSNASGVFAERPIPATSSATPPTYTVDFSDPLGSFLVGNAFVSFDPDGVSFKFYPLGNATGTTALPSKTVTVSSANAFTIGSFTTQVDAEYDAAGNLWYFGQAGLTEILIADLMNAPDGTMVTPHTIIGYGSNANNIQLGGGNYRFGDVAFDAANNIYVYDNNHSPNVLVFPSSLIGTTTASATSNYYYTASVPAADNTAGMRLGDHIAVDPLTGDVVIAEGTSQPGKIDFFYPLNFSSIPPGTIVPLKQYSTTVAGSGASVHFLTSN